MSRIHGLRAVVANSIENASLRLVDEGVYGGISDDKLAQISSAGKVEASAIVDGANTIAFDGDLSFAGSFTTTGAFPIELTATEATSLTLPVSGTLATEAYVNTFVQGLDLKASVRVATTGALAAVTYDNGTAGVGATLTADANGAIGDVDGVTLLVGDRVLVKNQAAALQNGIYTVTQLGDAGTPFILTRSLDCDGSPANEVSGGAYAFVEAGGQAGYGYVVIHDGNVAVGTDAVNFTLFSSADAYVAGNGIDITGQTIAIHADYWDDLEAADTLALSALVDTAAGSGETATGGLTSAHLQLLANIVNEAACTYDDFVKLHDLTVSAIDLSDVAQLSRLDDITVGDSGATLIGYDNSVSGLTAATVQAAIDELKSSLGGASGDLGDLIALVGGAGPTYVDQFNGANYISADETVVAALMTLDTNMYSGMQFAANLDNNLSLLDGTVTTLSDDYNLFKTDLAGTGGAVMVGYDDGASGLGATDVQSAIDELSSALDGISGGASAVVDYEFVAVVGDTSEVEYTTLNPFLAGSLKVWVNGVLMSKNPASVEYVTETTPASGTFTFSSYGADGAIGEGDEIIVAYRAA